MEGRKETLILQKKLFLSKYIYHYTLLHLNAIKLINKNSVWSVCVFATLIFNIRQMVEKVSSFIFQLNSFSLSPAFK